MHPDPDAIRIAFLADSAYFLGLVNAFNAWQACEYLAEQRVPRPQPSCHFPYSPSGTPRSRGGHQTVMSTS